MIQINKTKQKKYNFARTYYKFTSIFYNLKKENYEHMFRGNVVFM